ncbi:TetR/AcrR family transcriptional regulator [Cellulomonas sp. ACRRI]|uniref:TetR/AcrR family transcriptional regulator n=1 Tax=Cellulomonas sp. ACRRI TaxID=2918188 RepID=UPI001EF321C4|nr:TetR/AcrR family transcriptional regulator [Cellulomonas sp. ACRRI]MCG7285209.1 TetR/AcrR family transcriptional regulator [Cellulomonas sp. ACRRI]
MTTGTATAEGAVRRAPGRPRDEELDGQIIAATLALIDAEEEVTVARVVARSGVSRAALYRRWPSLTTLIAAALDVGRTVPPDLPADGDLRATVFGAMFGGPGTVTAVGYSEARFRQRIRLVMSDRALQRAYWTSHVARRRVPVETALRSGMERGVLRPDLDVAACFDAVAGAAYYQVVVRGDRFEDPETQVRLRAAFDVVWRGMLA